MINFKKIGMQDKIWIDKIVHNAGIWGAEYTFTNNFLWDDFYDVKIIDDGKFFTALSFSNQGYLYPVADQSTINYDDKLKIMILNLIEDAECREMKFKLYGLTDESKDKLESLFPGKFGFSLDRDSADYIYKIQDLVNLVGRKYHSRRNAISAFKGLYPNWEYKILTEEFFEQCIEINEKWIMTRTTGNSRSIESEHKSIVKAFENYDKLGLMGGIICVDSKVAGFTVGSKINDKVVDINIQKGLIEYKGIYSILDQQFLLNSCSNYEYVNKEEDLGIEYLRKAKLRQHPCKILEKYEAHIIE
jgi:hypothetical protein